MPTALNKYPNFQNFLLSKFFLTFETGCTGNATAFLFETERSALHAAFDTKKEMLSFAHATSFIALSLSLVFEARWAYVSLPGVWRSHKRFTSASVSSHPVCVVLFHLSCLVQIVAHFLTLRAFAFWPSHLKQYLQRQSLALFPSKIFCYVFCESVQHKPFSPLFLSSQTVYLFSKFKASMGIETFLSKC